MKVQGKITEYGISRHSGKGFITLEVEPGILDRLNELLDKALDVTLSVFRKKRSLNANAYYWKILTLTAEKLKTSNTELHNQLLSRCGYLEYWDDKPVSVPIRSDINPFTCEFMHLKPTSEIVTNSHGKSFTWCMVLRGSHTFNTAEMSRLIDELVSEAEPQGIDCKTPDERAHMMELYEEARSWERRSTASYRT